VFIPSVEKEFCKCDITTTTIVFISVKILFGVFNNIELKFSYK